MKQAKNAVLKITLVFIFWFSVSGYAADAATYDRSTPKAAFLSMVEATQQGDYKALLESLDLETAFEQDPRLKQLKLNAEQQQLLFLKMEGKMQPALQEIKDHLDKKGGVKEVIFDSEPEEKEGFVVFNVTVLFNNGEKSGSDEVKMIKRNGEYKMLAPEL